MPCLYISTNINLDGINIDPIFSQATTAVSTIIGKPEKVCHTPFLFSHSFFPINLFSILSLCENSFGLPQIFIFVVFLDMLVTLRSSKSGCSSVIVHFLALYFQQLNLL